MVSERPGVVRSYQRVFRPDRRVYAIDGRTIPVPGGIPLRWLTTFSVAWVAGLLLAALSPAAIIAACALAGWSVRRLGRRRLVAPVVAATGGGLVAVGLLVGALDWPLRLVVLPAVAATALTQLAADGRSPQRFAASWLTIRLAGRRRLGDPLRNRGGRGVVACEVRVAGDAHLPVLRRAALSGPGRVRFAAPVAVRRMRRARVVGPLDALGHPGGLMVDRLDLADGDRVRVRP